jgi:hypothetical protein
MEVYILDCISLVCFVDKKIIKKIRRYESMNKSYGLKWDAYILISPVD